MENIKLLIIGGCGGMISPLASIGLSLLNGKDVTVNNVGGIAILFMVGAITSFALSENQTRRSAFVTGISAPSILFAMSLGHGVGVDTGAGGHTLKTPALITQKFINGEVTSSKIIDAAHIQTTNQ